jgi:hypothetical protein
VVFSTTLYRENRALREETFAASSAVTRFVPLETLRGATDVEITAPPADELTLLLVDSGPTPYDFYRGELTRRDGASQLVWRATGLDRTPDGSAVGIGVPGRMLTPGDYEVSVDGRMNDWPAERLEAVARVQLRVVARQ